MFSTKSAVAVYNTHEEAEQAVTDLQHARINMQTLSIVARDYHNEQEVVGYYSVGEGMKRWGKKGAFWGAFWGLLFGSGFFALPGFGPILVAGPLVTLMLAALDSAGVMGGRSALGAGLLSMGIPKNSALGYESDVKSDKFVLIVNGTELQVGNAREVLETTRPARLALHLREALLAAG